MNGKFRTMMGGKWIAAAIVAIASTTMASAARADGHRSVDWVQGLVDLDRLARGDDERPTAHRDADRPSQIDDPNPQNMGNAWFGVAPRVTLVARDWASSTRLAGDRLSLVEEMRLSASTRMVVGRARLSTARLAPFLQAGIGQWRVDRNYLPLAPRVIEVASQVGTGFELRVSDHLQIAAEATVTSLIRDGQHDDFPRSMLWGTFIAARAEF